MLLKKVIKTDTVNTESLYYPIFNKIIGFVIKNIPKNLHQTQIVSLENSMKHFRRK